MHIRFSALQPSPAVAAALLSVLLLAGIAAGHEGHRVAQLAVLALPALLCLRFPLKSRCWRICRLLVVSGTMGLFLVDGAVRAFLQAGYRALPDSSLVLAAVANTTPREIAEYVSSQKNGLLVAGLALLLAWVAATWLAAACNRHGAAVGRAGRWVMVLLALVCLVGLASKPWRRHHPLLFWPAWVQSVQALQHSWSDQREQRGALLANAHSAAAGITLAAPSTVVLVLTDSVNRDNMSLYGYPRDTTPELQALRQSERDHLLVLRHAWSVEPSTVASLSGIFSFGARDQDDPVRDTHHLLALARAAGYRVWWLSNHDDIAIDQQHARLADFVAMNNREPGRSSSSLDGELLDDLDAALQDKASHKLIVVHLLGAHPHYHLRIPEAMRPFPDAPDAVDAEMLSEQRPAWLRSMRRTYDRAIRYHDSVVAQTLRLARLHAPQHGHAAWMFLSDHGQEVGHDIDHAGHSPGTMAGYRIPTLLWRHGKPFDHELARRPFRADWSGWVLADLMGLSWAGMDRSRNVLDPAYDWQAPQLAISMARYDH